MYKKKKIYRRSRASHLICNKNGLTLEQRKALYEESYKDPKKQKEYVNEQVEIHKTELNKRTGLPLYPKEDKVEGEHVRCHECFPVHIPKLPPGLLQ